MDLLQAAVPSVHRPAVGSVFQTDGRKHHLLPFRRKVSFPSAGHTVRQLKPATLKLHNFYYNDFRRKAILPLPMDAIYGSYPFRVYLQIRTIINIKNLTNKGEHSARPYPFPGSLESPGREDSVQRTPPASFRPCDGRAQRPDFLCQLLGGG